MNFHTYTNITTLAALKWRMYLDNIATCPQTCAVGILECYALPRREMNTLTSLPGREIKNKE
jgi:hypothetical protein